MQDKRQTANAMYIAKALGRKGYATEGTVEDENAYLRELQERAAQMNQSVQPVLQPTQPVTVTDMLRQGREKLESFSPFRIGEAAVQGGSEGVQQYMNRPYGYTEQERQNYPGFTSATEQYVPYAQRAWRQFMYPFHAIVPGVQAGVTQGVQQFTGNTDLARQVGREAAGMTEWGMTRGDIVNPRAPRDTDAIPRGGEVLPPVREARQGLPGREPAIIDQAAEPQRALPEPQRALPAPEPVAQEPVVQPPVQEAVQPVVSKPPVPQAPPRNLSPLGFYSIGEEATGSLQPKGSAGQYVATLRNRGVPQVELKKFENAFPKETPMTSEEVQSFFRENVPSVRETVYRKDPDAYLAALKEELKNQLIEANRKVYELDPETPEYKAAKDYADTLKQKYYEVQLEDGNIAGFEKYTMPGGENYREIVLRHEGPKYAGKTYDEWKSEVARLKRLNRTVQATYDDHLALQEAYSNMYAAERLFNYYRPGVFHHDVPDVIGHLRLKERMTPENLRDTNIEEAQADPAQRGRDQGFITAQEVKERENVQAQIDQAYKDYQSSIGKIEDRFAKMRQDLDEFYQSQRDAGADQMRQEMLDAGVTNFRGLMSKFMMSPRGITIDYGWKEAKKKLEAKYDQAHQAAKNDYFNKTGSLKQRMEEFGEIPESPFVMKPEEYAKLLLRRALTEAVNNGSDTLSITPADEHVKRYGTDYIRWLKQQWEKDDKWMIDAGQVSHDRVDALREEAIDDPHTTVVETKEDLKKFLQNTFSSVWPKRKIAKQTESIWQQMNTPDKTGSYMGFITPRKTGLEGWYNRDLPNYLNDVVRRMDPEAKLESGQVIISPDWPSNAPPQVKDVLQLRITPKIREAVQKGLPIYAKAEGGAVGMADGGVPDVIDLETKVPERKWYEPFDLETQAPNVGPWREEPAPPITKSEPYVEREYVPYTPVEEPKPAPSPMAYAPPQPSTVGNNALAAIRRAAPPAKPPSAMPVVTPPGESPIYSDISRKSMYYGDRSRVLQEPAGIVFHHTAGRGTPEGVMAALNAQKFAVHYIIDRDGRIHQSLPTNQYGIHTGLSEIPGIDNRTTLGVELIANNDQDVTPAQIEASKRLYSYLQGQYPKMQAYGHGELSTNRLPDEGYRVVMAIRGEGGKWKPSGGRQMPNVPIERRTIGAYKRGEFKEGGKSSDLSQPNVDWRVIQDPFLAQFAPDTGPQGRTLEPETIRGSVGVPLAGGTLSAFGGVNPNYASLPSSPIKRDMVYPTYGLSYQKRFKDGGTVVKEALMLVSSKAKRRRGRPD